MGVMTSETAPATAPDMPTFRLCNDTAELDALTVGTALYSAGTGRVWEVRPPYSGPRWAGPSGKYPFTEDFLRKESPLYVIEDPTR